MQQQNENTIFETLLRNNKDITVHKRNLQILMTKVYKIVKSETQTIMKNLFSFRENFHDIRYFQIIANENKIMVGYRLQTIYYITRYLSASLQKNMSIRILLKNLKIK